jgi:hypothetical protein
MNFKNFIKIVEQGGAYLSSNWTNSEAPDTFSVIGRKNHLPSTDFVIPNITKTGKIEILIKNKNPIFIQLSDGSKLFFTLDEFKRIKGEPKIGKMMTVEFQRHLDDLSDIPSKIIGCQAH